MANVEVSRTVMEQTSRSAACPGLVSNGKKSWPISL